MLLQSTLLALGLLASASPRVPFETSVRPHDPARSSWVRSGKPAPGTQMKLTVALKIEAAQRAELERTFWAVSDPRNERYGKHLTVDEVTEILEVPSARVERVRMHFARSGAIRTKVNPNRDMITVTLPVAAAELALETKIHEFEHKERKGVKIMRASAGYSLPASIADDVVMVGELLQFPRLRSKSLENLKGSGQWPNSCDSSSCAGLVQPAVLAQRYKLPNNSEAVDGNSMAVAEFQGQFWEQKDIDDFGTSCKRDVSVATQIGENGALPGVESELDVEYIKSVAPSVPLTVIYQAQYSLIDWANSITSNDSSPLVNSVSYGNDEAQQSSKAYMFTCNTAFMKAGTMGRSILFASGDQGVCGREGCEGIFKKASFKPDFPGGSPYITVVGGTNFAGDNIGDEEVWSAGGGGFSNTFDIPSYQADAVSGYKSSPDANLPPQEYWNNTGRGYPDVSALGGTKTPYCIASGGRFAGVAGTSAACPVVAGVFALLNGERLKAGKSPLGFLNPFIYQNPTAFQDVQSGMNNANFKYGFTAIKGWDAASGFGTPDYEALSKAAQQL